MEVVKVELERSCQYVRESPCGEIPDQNPAGNNYPLTLLPKPEGMILLR